jgi:hypothetical protein
MHTAYYGPRTLFGWGTHIYLAMDPVLAALEVQHRCSGSHLHETNHMM